jgi:predicted ATPase with chaperone activity
VSSSIVFTAPSSWVGRALPALTLVEALETTCIHRVAALTGARTALVTTRPCRAPHHTIPDVGRIGGGHVPMPGDSTSAPQTRRAQKRS